MKIIFLPVIIAVLMMSSSFSFAQTGINEENNTVRFNNVLTYEGYADNKTDRKNILDLYSKSTTLTTLLEAGDTTEAVPEFIKMIANSDYIFTIGDYLIKFDMANDRVLLINKNYTNAYQALQNNNTSQAGMMELNNDVDNGIEILEGLENGTIKDTTYHTSVNLVSGCSGAKRRTDKEDKPAWSTLKIDEVDFTNLDEFCTTNGCSGDMVDYEMDNKVVYQKYVFYFRLIAKMKSGHDCAGYLSADDPGVNKDLKGVGDATYEARPCNGEQNKKFDAVEYAYVMGWTPYEGSKGLNRYIVTVNFSIKHTWEQTYTPSRQLQIKYGY